MSDPIAEMLLRQLNTNPTSIERWIMLGVVRSGRFYRSIRNNVCARQPDGRLRQDFLTPRYNQLYTVADRFWRLLDRQPLDADMEAPRHLLATLLQDDLELGRIDEPDHQLLVEEFAQFFYAAATVHPLMLKALHGPLKVWLDMRMATLAVNAAHLDGQTSRLSMSRLTTVMSDYRKAANMSGQKVVGVTESLDGRRTFYRRISSGLVDLDAALGGGFGRGEAALMAGANGAGKTVLACQFAVEFAKQGLTTAYISTEQTPLDLTYRMLSNYSGVLFSYFTNREEMRELERSAMLDLANLPPLFATDSDAQMGLGGFRSDIAPRIRFVDWADGAAPIVQDAFEPAMDALSEQLGRLPDVVIFDWIGGAMERGKDKEHLRHYYYDAVNHLVNYAKSHPAITVIILAQIDKAKAEKAHCIKMVHLAECKAMSDNVSTFIGISSISEGTVTDGMKLEEPKKMQLLNVEKARFGPKGSVRVMRLFETQKFGSVQRT